MKDIELVIPKRAVVAGFDVNGTLDPNDPSLTELHDALQSLQADQLQPFHYGPVTGNNRAAIEEMKANSPIFDAVIRGAEFMVTSVGASVSIRNKEDEFVEDASWPRAYGGQSWNAEAIQEVMAGPELQRYLTPQPPDAQGEFKLSYYSQGVAEGDSAFVGTLRTALEEAKLAAHVIFSNGRFVDFLPDDTHKGSGFLHAAGLIAAQFGDGKGNLLKYAYQDPLLIAAGDTMNDCDLFLEADTVIVVGNADEGLRAWAQERIPDRTYFAEAHFAAGILEGMRHLKLAA